ncbi:calycin-like domain-containing protein [Myroides sp. LoEW2-1]|uniref:calycin-like domain-containing protein n=1 Tax=Myroides sp. LoEW2-1 TaxID=2683192 RepID=UPI001329DCED|nr:calycin-like domain-containing protein [Myroides sp. LoEW2-1]MVX36055.1 hypothetical protein [Myroides sp. LoEW2-1]
MKNFKFITTFSLFLGVLILSSCSTDDNQDQSLNQQVENKTFFHDLFNQQTALNSSRYTTFAAGDYTGVYTGTYVINSMLAGSQPGDYADVQNKNITFTVDETNQTIGLVIEPFKVGKMPANIEIAMEDIPYIESGNMIHFQGTQVDGFSVLGAHSTIDVDGTIAKNGTSYFMQLNFTANSTWGPMVINADVDFTGTK